MKYLILYSTKQYCDRFKELGIIGEIRVHDAN